MTSHLGVMLVFAAVVAIVFAVLMREGSSEQFNLGVRIFASLAGGALVVGWIMFALAP